MVSESKSGSIFTGNPTGGTIGDSDGVKITKVPGGTINSAYPQDNVHGVNLPNTTGDTMGGSCTNIGHSLSGASAVQRGGHGGKTEKSGI